MKCFFVLFFLVPFLLFLPGCGKALYISKLGWHQAHISFRSLPIEEVLKDRQVNQEVQEKIRYIQEVKEYGEEKLGLKRTKSYLRFYEVKGPILYVVTASSQDRFNPVRWSFPIVGEVNYKGFFTREAAFREKEDLDKKGFDTYLRPAEAYSTLGWLNDPIFSSMLEWNEETLANLILHEMAHATVYFKGKTDLNEQMATFIGNQGAIDFLTERYGSGSKEVLRAAKEQEDDLLFSRWIDQVYERLSRCYVQETSREEKLEKREEIFRSLQDQFRGMKSQFKTGCHLLFDQIPLNNAVVLAHRQYYHRLDAFESLHGYLGQDLRRVVELMKEVRASGEEPFAYLDRWTKGRELNASFSPR